MNAGSNGMNAVHGLGGFGGAAVTSAGGVGNDAQAIIIILPGKRDPSAKGNAAGKGDSTDISDSSCDCEHDSPAPAPVWKTPAPEVIPSAGAFDLGEPAGSGNSGGVLQTLVAMLAVLMLLLKRLLGRDDSGPGNDEHDHASEPAPARQEGNGPPRVIVIDP